MGFFLEVLIGGLLAGVLYSLVALGFVLIFKASGVFNFAQGAMVLAAALALVRALEVLGKWGLPFWAALTGADTAAGERRAIGLRRPGRRMLLVLGRPRASILCFRQKNSCEPEPSS